MTAYYNEFDPFAAAWLRELIKRNLIAPGEVDERDIRDVRPDDLRGFDQCHFFAGIGGWPYALRLAGWPDDRPVWTGSCPCQPFSAAGKGGGFADDRHLWPEFYRLIGECRPAVVFGEQVASKDGLNWLDLVQADMEAKDYAFAAVDLCAAGVGAPHIRQRLFWVADALSAGWAEGRAGSRDRSVARGAAPGKLADSAVAGRNEQPQRDGGTNWWSQEEPRRLRDAIGLADPGGARLPLGPQPDDGRGALRQQGETPAESGTLGRPSPTNGHWRDADWLGCTDGKWRPVEPGTFPLAHGIPNRVGSLRGYGNAIVPQVAAEFIAAYLEATS